MSARGAAALVLLALALAAGCADDAVSEPVTAPAPSSGGVPLAAPGAAAGKLEPIGAGDYTVTELPPPRAEVASLIGLVPSTDTAITDALAAGIRRALDESRAAGGPDLGLRVAEQESRWSAAAEAAVRMALDEGALAIITPPERERAHAVAQMGTKARVPIVSTSPWASVMQAGSTWVTSVVPPEDTPRVDPAADWEEAGYQAAQAILTQVRKHGTVRHPWR